jgi:hypothetical protein
MAKFVALFLDEDTGDIKVLGVADSKAEAIAIRAKKAVRVIQDCGMDEEDEEAAIATVTASTMPFAEWNGMSFQVLPVDA